MGKGGGKFIWSKEESAERMELIDPESVPHPPELCPHVKLVLQTYHILEGASASGLYLLDPV